MNIGDLTVKIKPDLSEIVSGLRAAAREINAAADRIEREAAEEAGKPPKPPAVPWMPTPTYPPGYRVTSDLRDGTLSVPDAVEGAAMRNVRVAASETLPAGPESLGQASAGRVRDHLRESQPSPPRTLSVPDPE